MNINDDINKKRLHLKFSHEMAFLLLDDPSEACYYINNISRRYLYVDTFWVLLLNGQSKKIKHWDLKMLCALCLCVRSLVKVSHLPISDDNDTVVNDHVNLSTDERVVEGIHDELILWCKKISGKEKHFFSEFRLKLFDIFSTSSKEALIILRAMHVKYYGNVDDELFCETVRVSPLLGVLQLMSDGHLCDTTNMNNVMNKLLKEHLISYQDIPTTKTIQTLGHGTYVHQGECLIINQLFKNKPNHRREGTENDELELVSTWEKLGCRNRIRVERDLTKYQMIKVLKEFRAKLRSVKSCDFMVIIILSHGKRDVRTGADYIMDINMNGLEISKIKSMFIDGYKCPSMIGRPKLFFIQACRGGKTQGLPNSLPR